LLENEVIKQKLSYLGHVVRANGLEELSMLGEEEEEGQK